MIDAAASHTHLVDHLAPIWCALPDDTRGTFWVATRPLAAHADRYGITTTVGYPHHTGPATIVANHHDYRQVHGRRPIIYLEHGAGQSYIEEGAAHPSYSGGGDRDRVSLFLTPNATTALRERAAYPDATVAVVGSPRLDHLATLRADPPDEQRVAFAFHWDCSLLPETRETFTYWRRTLRALHEEGHWQVAGHAHPRIAGNLARHFERWGIPFARQLDDVIPLVNILAVDNSSVMFEAAALDIPIVALNHPRYRRDVHHGLRFWDSVPGPQADTPDDLPGALLEALHPAWAERRAEVTERIYPPHTRGHAARLAAEAVLAHVGA